MIDVTYGDFKFSNASGYTVPLVSVAREFQRNGAGQVIGGTYSINLEGKILVPLSGTTFNSGLNLLLSYESGLRKAFSIDGYTLKIGSSSYSGIKISKYSVDKTDNNWTNNINYSIDLISEIDSTGNNSGCFLVSSTQDEWTIDTTDDFSYSPSTSLSQLGFKGSSFGGSQYYPLYKITRTLGAVGKFQPNSGSAALTSTSMTTGISPLQNAEKWVNAHIAEFPVTGIIKNLTLYNFTRNVSKSETEGSFRIADTWLASTTGLSNYTETFTIDSSLDNAMIRTVTINGTIKGLEKFDNSKTYSYSGKLVTGITPTTSGFRLNNTDRFSNAISGYVLIKPSLFTRVQQFCGTGIKYGSWSVNSQFGRAETSGLNPIPITSNETFNPTEGSIQYTYSYSNRPSRVLSDSITENISVNDKGFVPKVASIFALFRSNGPILQDLGTISSSTRRVSFEATFPKTGIANLTYPPPQLAIMTGVVERFDPAKLADGLVNVTTGKYIKSYVKEDSVDWNLMDNKISIVKSWEWVLSYIKQ